MKLRVLNRRDLRRTADSPAWDHAVYVGRPTKWGNPYEVGKDGDLDHVLMRYEQYLVKHPELVEAAKRELKGRNLVCWCSPKKCHATTLLRIANG